MRLNLRPPPIVLAVGLLALLLLLATLQYVWLGRISEAERERLKATLAARTSEFAQDFDRELTRAYLLFQTEAPRDDDAASRLAERYDRWQATSAYPRLVRDFYIARRDPAGEPTLQRFDPASRTLTAVAWPASMSDWRTRIGVQTATREGSRLIIRRLPAPIWETVPALIVPAPMLFARDPGAPDPFAPPELSFTVLALDVEYVKSELLPSLVQRHFRQAGDSSYEVMVVDRAGSGLPLYQSAPSVRPQGGGDASARLFQIRLQDFGPLAAEVKRFAKFTTTTGRIEERVLAHEKNHGGPTGRSARMSIVVQQGAEAPGAAGDGASAQTQPRWEVIVKHPAGSLEAFVGSTRRRNLIVSTSILAVLGASMALLLVSTRRSQELARQQLEFVAAVSHELRTPLAVIRSAGENLADGVIDDQAQVRKYGDLIRAEGRRLSEMVEQILELAGIQSGQRGFTLRPVGMRAVVDDVIAASGALLHDARMGVRLQIPDDLPPVLGDEGALRRVVQNLIGNALKYGAGGGWIGIRLWSSGGEVGLSVTDNGIGIAPAEQGRIFEPFYRSADVVAARIQGAGLGLSLVQRIVHGHGGTVSVRSAPGSGSEFTVLLPAAAPDRPGEVQPVRGGARSEAAPSS